MSLIVFIYEIIGNEFDYLLLTLWINPLPPDVFSELFNDKKG